MNLKKLACMFLAVLMILAMAVPAMAGEVDTPEETKEGYTITINNTSAGHTFAAYQIFAGDLHESTLSNIVWGSGVNTNAEGFAEAFDEAPVEAAELTDGTVAAFAKEIAGYLGTVAATATVAKDANSCELTGLEAGYYLVQNTGVADVDGVYTSYILVVVKDVEANAKADVPEVEKKVMDTNDSTGETTDWQDSADYDIGDAVPFKLTATLANNVEAYNTYKIVFHDTLSAGLTYNNDAVVKFGETVVTSYFTTNYDQANGKLTISCDDVKEFGATDSSVITVEYTATLNEDAEIGSAGNPNVVYLEYSNNPNWKPVDNNNDGKPDEEEPTGETPEDKVIVFTFKTIVNKVDENKQPLKGAGFTLYKWVIGGVEKTDENGNVVLEGDTPVMEDGWVAVGEEVEGEDMTTFTWKGLDDGDYKLVETTTPAGYNTIADIEFTITAEHVILADNPTLTSLTGGDLFTGDVDAGTLTTDVENKAGTKLPSTGGIGTTIFYIAGAILVVGAVVVMISKKRSSEK